MKYVYVACTTYKPNVYWLQDVVGSVLSQDSKLKRAVMRHGVRMPKRPPDRVEDLRVKVQAFTTRKEARNGCVENTVFLKGLGHSPIVGQIVRVPVLEKARVAHYDRASKKQREGFVK